MKSRSGSLHAATTQVSLEGIRHCPGVRNMQALVIILAHDCRVKGAVVIERCSNGGITYISSALEIGRVLMIVNILQLLKEPLE